MIVGVGRHSNKDKRGNPLTESPSFPDDDPAREVRAVGGEEQVKLTIDEMPNHYHKFHDEPRQFAGAIDDTTKETKESFELSIYKAGDPGVAFYVRELTGLVEDHTIEEGSGDVAHNNMQPYIALYFCKKE